MVECGDKIWIFDLYTIFAPECSRTNALRLEDISDNDGKYVPVLRIQEDVAEASLPQLEINC